MLKTVLTILAVVALGGSLLAGGMAVYDLFRGREQRYREMHREHLKQQSRVDEQLSERRNNFFDEDDS